MPELRTSSSKDSTWERSSKACRTCAAAKTKCIQHVNEIKCERCRRLNKTCVWPTPAARSRKPKRITRTAQLEQKIDSLVSLIAQQQNHSKSPVSESTVNEPVTVVSHPASGQPTVQGSIVSDTVFIPFKYSKPESIPEFDPHSPLSAHLLNVYQNYLASHFPFVVIPAEATTESLSHTRPSLFCAIMVVASIQDLARQRTLGRELMKHISDRLLVRGEKDLDLAQSILVFVAWFHPHLFVTPQLTTLLQLLLALIIDLGFPKTDGPLEKQRLVAYTTAVAHGEAAALGIRNSDERRALAGCFYLHSIVSAYFRKLDPMRDSTQLEECLNALEEAAEYPSDLLLVKMVHLQRVVVRIRQSPLWQYPTQGSCTPIGLYLRALESELQQFKNKLSDTLAQNNLLLLQFHCAEALLYEVALHENADKFTYDGYPFGRIDVLYSGLRATKAMLDCLMSPRPSSFLTFPFPVFGQIAAVAIMLSRLSFIEGSGWDREQASEVLDLFKFLDALANRFETVKQDAEASGICIQDNDFFDRLAARFNLAKTWYGNTQQNPADAEIEGDVTGSVAGNGQFPSESGIQAEGLAPGTLWEPLDGLIWPDFLGDWDTLLFDPK